MAFGIAGSAETAERGATPLGFCHERIQLNHATSLKELIDPLSVSQFLGRYWGRKPFLKRRSNTTESSAPLMACVDFDFLIHSLTNPRDGWFSIVKGVARPPTVTHLTEEGLLNLTEIYRAYSEGHSLLANQVQRRHRRIGTLCRELEREFSERGIRLKRHIGANAYLSPPHSQGFAIHYDPHDVLIMQLEGMKQWRVYGRGAQFPITPPAKPVPRKAAGRLKLNFQMKPGDVLYIPRGFLHEARTGDSRSLHLTLSIETVTWLDLIARIAEQNDFLRQDIPASIDDHLPSRDAKKLSAALRDGAAARRALRFVSQKLLSNLDPLPNGGFDAVDTRMAITADTVIIRTPGCFGTVELDGSSCHLHLPGNTFTASAKVAPAFRYMLESENIRPRDLPLRARVGEKIEIVRSLVSAGHFMVARMATLKPGVGKASVGTRR